MSEKTEKASQRFGDGFNCSQAVFSVFAPSLGIDENAALKIASGFGAGMSRLQEVCGAVTGAFMVIGAANGNITAADIDSKKKTYQLVRKFDKSFREMHGAILCRDLLGVDLNSEEGHREFEEKGLIKSVCAQCVLDAVGIVEEIVSIPRH